MFTKEAGGEEGGHRGQCKRLLLNRVSCFVVVTFVLLIYRYHLTEYNQRQIIVQYKYLKHLE